jgi:hypothetical protein
MQSTALVYQCKKTGKMTKANPDYLESEGKDKSNLRGLEFKTALTKVP